MFHIDLISIDWLLKKLMRWRINGHYSCPISFICRFSRSKQDFHWSIVSSKWKWFTRIWWNSLGSVDFLVDGHCCPISLHCPLKNSGQIEKSIRPLLMTIVHDHSIFPRPPWILRFPSLIEKIGPNSKLARFSLQIVQRSKRWRLRWSRRNPFSLMISGDSISGSSRDHLDMLTRSGESKIFAVFVESYCRFPQISYGHLMKLIEFPEEIEEKTIRNRSNLGVPENDRSRIRRTIWFTQCPSW